MAVAEKHRHPSELINIYTRRNGFCCRSDVKFDQTKRLFWCNLTIGDWVFRAYGKSKQNAKRNAAVEFLKDRATKSNRVDWGLPKEKAACEAYLKQFSEPVYSCTSPPEETAVSKANLPRVGHIMELKRICVMKRQKNCGTVGHSSARAVQEEKQWLRRRLSA
uniref:DRBM domain-containing protein n=1 Tax=Trichuris muris TaxID=70415 RepID=A0A5S6QK19_TRIMR